MVPRSRPLFLSGVPSVHHLSLFIEGYYQAAVSLDIVPSAEMVRFSRFEPWLHLYYGDRSNCSWVQLLLDRYPNDGTAPEEFWRLLDLYVASKPAIGER